MKDKIFLPLNHFPTALGESCENRSQELNLGLPLSTSFFKKHFQEVESELEQLGFEPESVGLPAVQAAT